MGFTNPPSLGAGVEQLASLTTPNDGSGGFLTDALGVAGAQSLLVVPDHYSTGPPHAWVACTVAYFADPAATIQLDIETFPVYDDLSGSYVPRPVILSQCKGPYAQVHLRGSTPSTNSKGSLAVYASNAAIEGSLRLDNLWTNWSNAPTIAGYQAGVNIISGVGATSPATGTLTGFTATGGQLQAMCLLDGQLGNVGTTTFTPSFTLKLPAVDFATTSIDMPLGAAVAGAGVTTPTGTTRGYTVPVTLPRLPAGAPFKLDYSFAFASPSASRLFTVTTVVY